MEVPHRPVRTLELWWRIFPVLRCSGCRLVITSKAVNRTMIFQSCRDYDFDFDFDFDFRSLLTLPSHRSSDYQQRLDLPHY